MKQVIAAQVVLQGPRKKNRHPKEHKKFSHADLPKVDRHLSFLPFLPFASDEIRCAFLPPVGTDVRAVKVFPHIKKTPL